MQTAPTQQREVVLDRYRLVRRLGAGAFGVVWLAHDEHLDRAVAVKRIGVEGAALAARAQREALAAARLAHPGIVALFEAGRDDDAVYLVSELVRGRTLAQLMADGELSDRDVVRVGVALCDALAHAHGRGVIHRDVKPGNVMVPDRPQEGAGVAKLTDFGVARTVGDEALTATGDVVGTLAYMAPEQADGRTVTPAADLYALGLVLFEGLAGVNPVRARGAAATARRVGVRLPPLGRMRRDLPEVLAAAVDRAVLPRPDQRGDLRDLRAALAGALEDVDDERGTIAGSPLEGLAAPPAARPHVRPRARLLAGVAAGGLVAAALAWLGPAPPVPPAAGGALAALAVAALPRVGWLAVAGALVAWLLVPGAGGVIPGGAGGGAQGAGGSSAGGAGAPAGEEGSLAGVALLLAAAALPTALLLRRHGSLWSVPAGAPVLGLAGLAGMWPALAGQAARPWQRLALGALGFWWLALAELVAQDRLALGVPPGARPRPAWEGSAPEAVGHALAPLVTSGALALAALWALAALVLPLLVRGRAFALDLVFATGWAAGLGSASQAVAEALATDGAPAQMRGLVAGAVAAGGVAIAARASRGAA